MKIHELKTINPYFTDVWDANKEFEIRKDDRNFELGDILWLREYDTGANTYSGRHILAEVSYILPAGEFEGLSEGYCAMQLFIIERKSKP
jgi:hypothetical protein